MEQYFAFQWHITDSCDQRCQHCYIFSENNNIILNEMPYEKIQFTFDNCLEMCKKLNRIPYFYLTGGDPILHRDFWKVLELFKSHDIVFTILGNPFHLNDDVCRKLRYYGCDKYQLSIDGLKYTHDNISPKEYRKFLEVCWKKFEEYKDSETTFNLKDHLWTLFLYEKGLFTIPEGLKDCMIYDGCNCGNCHLTILPNGDVYACRRFESLIGNTFKERMYDIFLGEKMDKYREYRNFEKCSKCELLRFCRVCPAVAYGNTHNFYGADPQCWKGL